MTGCAAVDCSNRSEQGFIMKYFPKDPMRRKEWAMKIRRKGWIPTDRSALCEVHFESSMWEKIRIDGKRKLKRDAVPTLFTFIEGKAKQKHTNNKKVKSLERDSSSAELASTSLESANNGHVQLNKKLLDSDGKEYERVFEDMLQQYKDCYKEILTKNQNYRYRKLLRNSENKGKKLEEIIIKLKKSYEENESTKLFNDKFHNMYLEMLP